MSHKMMVSGFASVVKSSEWSDAFKAKVLKAPKGQVRGISIPLYDAEGREVARVSGELKVASGEKSAGSLTARVGFQLDFRPEHLTYREPKGAKGTKKGKLTQKQLEAQAAELLGE